MLDTNIVIAAARGERRAREGLSSAHPSNLTISALSEAELLFGREKRERGTRQSEATRALLSRIRVLPWDSDAARAYAVVRTRQEAVGRPLARVDMFIAAHAMAVDATLVSRDQTFRHVPDLRWEEWRA